MQSNTTPMQEEERNFQQRMADRIMRAKQELGFPLLVEHELERARVNFRDMASAHEAFAVLKEEVDELWDRVKVKQSKRDPAGFIHELVQVGAMAQRFAEDIVFGDKLGE